MHFIEKQSIFLLMEAGELLADSLPHDSFASGKIFVKIDSIVEWASMVNYGITRRLCPVSADGRISI